jgi:hypothetical protein
MTSAFPLIEAAAGDCGPGLALPDPPRNEPKREQDRTGSLPFDPKIQKDEMIRAPVPCAAVTGQPSGASV